MTTKERVDVLSPAPNACWGCIFALARRFRPAPRILEKLDVWGSRVGTPTVLRALGATIGERTRIEPWLKIQNAEAGSCANLTIGDHVYVGPDVLLDLAQPIEIDSEVVIAGRLSILTHQSVGDRPLQKPFPRREGAVRVRRGAFLGFGSTIALGVTIGEYAVVGAEALVLKDVPPKTVVVGVPARESRTFEFEPDAL